MTRIASFSVYPTDGALFLEPQFTFPSVMTVQNFKLHYYAQG